MLLSNHQLCNILCYKYLSKDIKHKNNLEMFVWECKTSLAQYKNSRRQWKHSHNSWNEQKRSVFHPNEWMTVNKQTDSFACHVCINEKINIIKFIVSYFLKFNIHANANQEVLLNKYTALHTYLFIHSLLVFSWRAFNFIEAFHWIKGSLKGY